MQKSSVKEECDEVVRMAITVFHRLVRGCKPRVQGQSRYAVVTEPATTTQWFKTAAVAIGEVAITSICDVSSCTTK
ncbi:hypothetical protein MRX96_015176 [Rhipicephalus microplus]